MRSSTCLLGFLLAICLVLSAFCHEGHDHGHEEQATTESKVILLNNDNFKDIETGKWFIKYYAPWCGHCKRLAPVWEQLAAKVTKAKIAKLDCTVNEDICARLAIRGFPTLKYYEDGVAADYNGGRDLEDLERFVERMSQPLISDLKNEHETTTWLIGKPTAFLFFGDDAAKSVMDAVAKPLRASLDFGHVLDENLKSVYEVEKTPALVAITPDEKSVFDGPFEAEALTNFVKFRRFGLLPELGPNNFVDLQEMGPPLVIVAVNPAAVDFESTISVAREVAKNYRGRLVFSWLNGDRWRAYVAETYKVTDADLPLAIVLNGKENHYFKSPKIESANGLGAFFDDVLSGKIKPTAMNDKSGAPTFFSMVEAFCRTNMWQVIGAVFVVGFVLGYLVKSVRSGPRVVVTAAAPAAAKPKSQ